MDSKQRLLYGVHQSREEENMKQREKCTLAGQDPLGFNRTQPCHKAAPSFLLSALLGVGLAGGRDSTKT